jgi:hypothetical protein
MLVIICGDFNVNYFEDCPRKRLLEDLLNSFNLRSIITFPTRVGPSTSTIIDGVFIDQQQYKAYEILAVSNGLSDHEAQLLAINLPLLNIKEKGIYYSRNINNHDMVDFRMNLRYENWEGVFNNSDMNTSFNQFLNTFLRYFHASFPLRQRQKYKPNTWITTGIVISCRKKRILYTEVKNNNSELRQYYKDYCRILTAVINQAKRMTYDKQIRNFTNKIRTTWKIIDSEIHKKAKKDNIQILHIEGKNTNNLNIIVDAFNNYFNKIADNFHNRIKQDGVGKYITYVKSIW